MRLSKLEPPIEVARLIEWFVDKKRQQGLLKPVSLDFSDLTPPDTRMAKDAEEFARGAYTQDLLSHGYRTYYFGAMIAAYRKLKYDKEVYFSAAILHDIGLTESRISPLTRCCFAVSVPLVIVGAPSSQERSWPFVL